MIQLPRTLPIRLLLTSLSLIFLSGCGLNTAPILDPKGPIALAERDLLFAALFVMMIVVIPVFVMAFLVVWRYRADGGKGKYTPDWGYSAGIDAVIWIVPAIIVIVLGVMLWNATFKLNPYKPLASSEPALEVQAIALDWKWLFVYPQYGVATVNEIAMPVNRPVSFRITSDTVMNSFFIPSLAGQIYAMAGMTTQLHLVADSTGTFRGRNTQYSGDGFAEQWFEAHSMSNEDFEAWIEKVKQSDRGLDDASYAELAKPTIKHEVEYYSSFAPGLFGSILQKYAMNQDHRNLICTATAQSEPVTPQLASLREDANVRHTDD
ncbi:ubiquinol oxidase subunit II [Hoeflea sp. CAU 1731]